MNVRIIRRISHVNSHMKPLLPSVRVSFSSNFELKTPERNNTYVRILDNQKSNVKRQEFYPKYGQSATYYFFPGSLLCHAIQTIVLIFRKNFIEPFQKTIVSFPLEFVSFSVHPITSICESLNGQNSKHFLLFSEL